MIDDVFLRMFGVSIPPFDMLWLMETITDFVENEWKGESQQKVRNKIKENRLLFELGEITREEYEARNNELNQELRMTDRINRTNFNQRISILG